MNNEWKKLIEQDENEVFIRLVIPANEPTEEYKEELNLIGKTPKDITEAEEKRLKKYYQKLLCINNKISDKLFEKVQEFAKLKGYQKADYINDWNGYRCFEPIKNEDKSSFIGLPLLILVDENENIRMSTNEEAMKQMREMDE